MTNDELTQSALSLEAEIRAAPEQERLSRHKDLAKVLAHLTDRGLSVPAGLRRLEQTLADELVEQQFNNMPV